MKSGNRVFGAIAIIPIAAALIAGCGKHSEGTSGEASQQIAVAPPSQVTTAVPAAHTPETDQQGAVMRPAVSDSMDSLPPDIVVTTSDTLVEPGDAVAFSVRGTSDVAQIVLWDGLNDKQALAYDGSSGVWRVTYRVPLRPASDRIGISLTATNDSHRWRRVWVFLRVQTEAPEPMITDAPHDS